MPATKDGVEVPPVKRYQLAPIRKSALKHDYHPVTWLEAYSKGNITNPNGMVGDGVTTLTRRDSADEMPSIVLDFGQNYVGILSIDFAGAQTFGGLDEDYNTSASALPGITLAFSESLAYLTNRSDFSRSDNLPDTAKLTNGTDQIAVPHAPYTWTDRLGCQYSTSAGSKVCADGLHGFRYLRLTLDALPGDFPHTAPYGTVSLASLALTLSAFHGTPETFAGHFECSDTALTQWWYDAVYTNDLSTDVFRTNDTEPRDAASNTTMLGKWVLHDGAKRDRDPYVGDLAVSALTLFLSHHDNARAARNVLADLAAHQRADGWIPPASINNYTLPLYDYPLWWVVCSSDLVLYTGDVGYLDEFYGTMMRVLDVYYPNSTNGEGLLEKGLGTSEGYGDYAFLPRSGTITYYNALYVLALRRAAQLAVFTGEDEDAARWRARADVVGAALIRRNWDPSVGALYDGGPCTTNGTGKCAVHAQDGNALAILSGAAANGSATAHGLVASPSESILAYLARALTRPYGNAFYDVSTLDPAAQLDQRVYAFISYFELAARFETAAAASHLAASSNRLAASAFDQLRRTYGHMAARDPFSTFWEGAGPHGSYYQAGYTSLAHGWSTGVVPLMQGHVLGVRPTGVGFATFEVRPVTIGGGLAWARGVVPVPGRGKGRGGVAVDWTVEDVVTGRGLRLAVEVPVGTVGTVFVPVVGGETRVLRDGLVIWMLEGGVVSGLGNVRSEDGNVVVVVEGGSSAILTTEA